MQQQSIEAHTYIIELTHAVVTDVAPEELDLFEELIAEYQDTAQRPSSNYTPTDDQLGFGGGELVVAITPLAAAMVSASLTYIGTELLKLVGDRVVDQVKRQAPRLFGQDDKSPVFRSEQLEQIRLRAYEEALAFGVDAALAERMSRALIGSLALAKP